MDHVELKLSACLCLPWPWERKAKPGLPRRPVTSSIGAFCGDTTILSLPFQLSSGPSRNLHSGDKYNEIGSPSDRAPKERVQKRSPTDRVLTGMQVPEVDGQAHLSEERPHGRACIPDGRNCVFRKPRSRTLRLSHKCCNITLFRNNQELLLHHRLDGNDRASHSG